MLGIAPSLPTMNVAGIGSIQASLLWAAGTSTLAVATIRSILAPTQIARFRVNA
jgi:hypothetical protein